MKNRIMLNTLFSIVMTVSILSCASQKNGTSQNDAKKDTNMDVSLRVTITSNYCGGAAPSEEMVSDLKVPKKFVNQKFHISSIEGLQDDMKEVNTSAAGTASVSLVKGTYYVFLPQKVSAKHSSKDRSEVECKKWKNTPNGTFTVGENNSISFNIHRTCDGCGALRM